MSGRRLLDAALVFKATRGVARQHLKIRASQVEVWSKTSSVAKALRSQTDRVTLTVQAANALLRRTQEEPPATRYTAQTQQHSEDAVPSPASVEHQPGSHAGVEGIKQDHHYKRSEENTTADAVAEGELPVTQKQAARYPTPDGSIPPAGAPVDTAEQSGLRSDVGEERPSAVPQAAPLAQEAGNQALKPQSSGESTIIDPDRTVNIRIPEHEAVPEQEEQPEGINTDVFHSPRVAKLLGGQKSSQKKDFKLQGAEETPINKSNLAEGKGQDTFNVRESGAKQTAAPEAETIDDGKTAQSVAADTDFHNLAADLAKDAAAAGSSESQVS